MTVLSYVRASVLPVVLLATALSLSSTNAQQEPGGAAGTSRQPAPASGNTANTDQEPGGAAGPEQMAVVPPNWHPSSKSLRVLLRDPAGRNVGWARLLLKEEFVPPGWASVKSLRVHVTNLNPGNYNVEIWQTLKCNGGNAVSGSEHETTESVRPVTKLKVGADGRATTTVSTDNTLESYRNPRGALLLRRASSNGGQPESASACGTIR